MTSSPHGPYIQGYTRTTMVGTEGRNTATAGIASIVVSFRPRRCAGVCYDFHPLF